MVMAGRGREALDKMANLGEEVAGGLIGGYLPKHSLEPLPQATPWPDANARLLGLGLGLPTDPLDRLSLFSPSEFERFALEWAHAYLPKKYTDLYEIQQRGGAGDKGRDIIAFFDPPGTSPRRWNLYQCKHLDEKLSSGDAATEIGKVLYYSHLGDYALPEEYWFVTHKGVNGPLQDRLDDPEVLKEFVIKNWDKYCKGKISSKGDGITTDLKTYIENIDFSIFRAKQPKHLLKEHESSESHMVVFGAPLINRPTPPTPPSKVAPIETYYVGQLYEVISEQIGEKVSSPKDFGKSTDMKSLFDRSRLTFYSAEGLKELARDQMADTLFFETLLDEFSSGLYHVYTAPYASGLDRLRATIISAQSQSLGGHPLAAHVTANDTEGACHQLANEQRLKWCKP